MLRELLTARTPARLTASQEHGSMRRTFIAASLLITATAAIASDEIFRLSGWAEIPSTYRHPGPTSGQFATGANGVTPPYQGQPIPGFSGVIPSPRRGRFIGLPDNGFGAQTNSADFVIGFYEFTPDFKTTGDGTTSRGPIAVNGFTPFSDPHGYLSDAYITGRSRLQPRDVLSAAGAADRRRSVHPVAAPADRRRLRRGIDRAHERRHVLGRRGVRSVPAALR